MDEWLSLFLSAPPFTPAEGDPLTETQALTLAIAEGFRGYGQTSPNPSVGCVIVDRFGKFLSSGFHARVGEPHAEAEALLGLNNEQKKRLEGAHVFVTLEPCAHQGRTPSCAKTLAALPIANVTALLQDPNELVAGKGFQILREAGKNVSCLEQDPNANQDLVVAARALCEFFLVNITEKRPFVSLKVATSLDGMMALKSGESQWLTGERSRFFARFLRGAHEVCLVGKNTILMDNPKLDARETPFQDLKRSLVILDTRGEVLKMKDLNIFKTFKPENILVCVGPKANPSSSSLAQVLRIESETPEDFLKEVLQKLGDRGLRSVWIEGGAETLSNCLKAKVGDRFWLFQGPHFLGAQEGVSWTKSWGVSQMRDRLSLEGVRHLNLGSDHLTTGWLTTAKS